LAIQIHCSPWTPPPKEPRSSTRWSPSRLPMARSGEQAVKSSFGPPTGTSRYSPPFMLESSKLANGVLCSFISRQRAINLHYSAPSSTPHRRQTSPARPASPRRTASSGSTYPPSPPSNRNQSTPIVARLGLGTVYGLFLPVRFVLRILIGFWYMLGRHQMIAVSPHICLLKVLVPPPT
jgi:hypothetical protein